MKKQLLTARTIASRARTPGVYGDGGGLYLVIGSTRTSHTGASAWVFRYMRNRKSHGMGLGHYPEISLAEARERAAAARKLLWQGIDPIRQRVADRTAVQTEAAKAISFEQAASRYIAAQKTGWRNAKHTKQWEASLATHAYPLIGKLAISAVETGHVMQVLEPLWALKPETASRVRGRVEVILDWARVRGFRAGENPARWRGHLDKLLPARARVAAVVHHAALPYRALPAFMVELRVQEGIAARALEFAILTAARTGEVIGARWAEIDLSERVWIIPATRMKAGREHRVPLAPAVLQVLKDRLSQDADVSSQAFVFPGAKADCSLSNMSLAMTLRRMRRDDITVHGFRSSFRDWAAEQTEFPSEVAELALAHTVGDKVAAAYRRTTLFDKRHKLAGAWAKFLRPIARSKGGKSR